MCVARAGTRVHRRVAPPEELQREPRPGRVRREEPNGPPPYRRNCVAGQGMGLHLEEAEAAKHRRQSQQPGGR